MVNESGTSTKEKLVLRADFSNLSPVQLFNYFTKPDLITQWWASQAEIDAKLGGNYVISWPQMDWYLRGTYTEFVAGQALTFTWKWDHKPDLPERTVQLEFQARAEGGSTLVLMHGSYGDSDTEQEDRQSHLEGWQHFLNELAKLQPA